MIGSGFRRSGHSTVSVIRAVGVAAAERRSRCAITVSAVDPRQSPSARSLCVCLPPLFLLKLSWLPLANVNGLT
jgi:hypothetical protein